MTTFCQLQKNPKCSILYRQQKHSVYLLTLDLFLKKLVR